MADVRFWHADDEDGHLVCGTPTGAHEGVWVGRRRSELEALEDLARWYAAPIIVRRGMEVERT